MFFYSQDGKRCVRFDKVAFFELRSQTSEKCKILACIEGDFYEIGIYHTIEDCKEELRALMDWCVSGQNESKGPYFMRDAIRRANNGMREV